MLTLHGNSSRSHRFARYALLTLLCAAVPRLATAQTSDVQMANRRLLLLRAQEARDAGRHDEALDLASRAGEIQMSSSVRMFIAREHFTLEHLAEALDGAERCLADVARDPLPNARDRQVIQGVCQQLMDTLRARVGRVVVVAPSQPPAGLRVTIAGREVPPALYGQPSVVNPGSVVVEATAEGRDAFTRTVQAGSGQTETVEIVLPTQPATLTLRGDGELPAGTTVYVAGHELTTQQFGEALRVEPGVVQIEARAAEHLPFTESVRLTPGQRETVTVTLRRLPRVRRTQRILGWTGIGIGAALVTAGVVTGMIGSARREDYDDVHCAAQATPACVDAWDTLNALRTTHLTGLIAGGVTAVAGAVLVLTAPSSRERVGPVAFGCGPWWGAAGVSCGGRF